MPTTGKHSLTKQPRARALRTRLPIAERTPQPVAIAAPQRDFSELLTRQDVAKLLNCSLPFIDKLLSRKALPCYRIGRAVRFDRAELQDAIRRGEVR